MGTCHNAGVHLTQIRLIVSDFPPWPACYREVIGLKPQSEHVSAPYAAFEPEPGGALCLHERADLEAALGTGVLAPSVGKSASPVGGDGALIALPDPARE
jgi:hypothetical protein